MEKNNTAPKKSNIVTKKVLQLVLFFAIAINSKAQITSPPNNNCTDLFITELTFGKNPEPNNTFDLNYAIEIFNPSSSSINLSNYTIELSTAGGVVSSIPLSGTLASHGVYVVGNSNADLNLQGICNQLSTNLDFELNVTIELKRGTIILDKLGIGGNTVPQAFDIVQFTADPYSYLLNFHLDLNDYQNIDLRRSMLTQNGNPNFNSSTDVIGEWYYLLNTDRSNIGNYYGVCNKPLNNDIIGFAYNTMLFLTTLASGSEKQVDFLVNGINLNDNTSNNTNLKLKEFQITSNPAHICNDLNIVSNPDFEWKNLCFSSTNCSEITFNYNPFNCLPKIGVTQFTANNMIGVNQKLLWLELTSTNPLVLVDPAKSGMSVEIFNNGFTNLDFQYQNNSGNLIKMNQNEYTLNVQNIKKINLIDMYGKQLNFNYEIGSKKFTFNQPCGIYIIYIQQNDGRKLTYKISND